MKKSTKIVIWIIAIVPAYFAFWWGGDIGIDIARRINPYGVGSIVGTACAIAVWYAVVWYLTGTVNKIRSNKEKRQRESN